MASRVMTNDKALESAKVCRSRLRRSEQNLQQQACEQNYRRSGLETETGAFVVSLPQLEDVRVEAQSDTLASTGSCNRTRSRTPQIKCSRLGFGLDRLHGGCWQIRNLSEDAEWEKRKRGPEPMRRKSHWDFVLEEMAWMANDFMQERLWKMASAIQFCRWIAQLKRQTDLQSQRQQKVARFVANFVECAVLKQNRQAFAAVKSGVETVTVPAILVGDDGEVLMDVDRHSVVEPLFPVADFNEMAGKEMLEKFPWVCKEKIPARQLVQGDMPRASSQSPGEKVISLHTWNNENEPLCYTVPNGALEKYRQSVEAHRALQELVYLHEDNFRARRSLQQEYQLTLQAQAATEVVAKSGFAVSCTGRVEDQTLRGLSSPVKRIRGNDDGAGDGAGYGGFPHSTAKKKRSKILKLSTSKLACFRPSSGLTRPSPFVKWRGSGPRLPPLVNPKRLLVVLGLPATGSTLPNGIVGSIPTKWKPTRKRSARQDPFGKRARSSSWTREGGLLIPSRRAISSGALRSNQKEVTDLTEKFCDTALNSDLSLTESDAAATGGGSTNSILEATFKRIEAEHFSETAGWNFE